MNGTNGDANGHSPKILALEIGDNEEEEHHSLLREITMEHESGDQTKVYGRNAHNLRRRARDAGGDDSNAHGNGIFSRGNSVIQGILRGDLMSHAMYHLRNALLLGLLAFFVLVVIEWEGGLLRSEQMEEKKPADPRGSPHQMSFGGKNNPGHNLDAKKEYMTRPPLMDDDGLHMRYGDDYEEGLSKESEILSEAFEMSGTWDISIENTRNEQAHYLHDPNLSPFASVLYAAEQAELDERQARFTTRMTDIINEFGQWNNDAFAQLGAVSVRDDFYSNYKYRDVAPDEFPEMVWQKDKEYITAFLDQAQALVEATKEGIMQEYNHPNPDEEEKKLFGVIMGDYDFINGTAHDKESKAKLNGVAYLPQNGWDGLVKKLLHAMITTDHFYVVAVGKDGTYRGNNFAQTQVMQFNYIMEPIFHKLGMTLISRNMGMGISPVASALGGADIYGESDILWHIQGHDEEEAPGEFDLLQKQAIMSGERIPVILSPSWEELVQASKGKAWVGNIQPGADICQRTTMEVLPTAPACHNVHCDDKAWAAGKCHVYKSVCWELRSDWNPPEQLEDVGDKDLQFSGYRQHQLEGRKMTLLVLHAIGAALSLWRDKLDDEQNPLPLQPEYWHVGDAYEDIRRSVMSLDRTPGEAAGVPLCEKYLKDLDPRICHIPMHALTEFTPRVVPKTKRLLAIVNNLIDGKRDSEQEDIYEGPDIVPLAWDIPDNELDLHMIAIASNRTDDSTDDDAFPDGMDDDYLYGTDHGGRNLKKRKPPPVTKPEPVTTPEPVTEPEPLSLTGTTMVISEGVGWQLENVPKGFCDGSAQSRCNRSPGNLCLLANHNFYSGSIVGTPQTSWLTMGVSKVRHGIILARLDFLGAQGSNVLPDDLMFDYAVNGMVTSIPMLQLKTFGKELASGLRVFPLVLERDRTIEEGRLSTVGENYDVAIRIRSNSDPNCTIYLSHIYYA